MIANGVLGSGSARGRGNVTQTPSPSLPGRSSSVTSSLGLPFDPYDYTPLPGRILATGAATNFPSVANLVGDVFNAPVFVPTTQVDSAQVVPHRNAPASGFPGRAALGGAYIARWVWGKKRSSSPGGSGAGRGLGAFEEEMRRLLGKRWVATGALPLRTNVNGAVGVGNGGSGANSGTSTPFGHGSSRSGLGSTVFVEEDEDEVEEMERNGGSAGGYGYGEIGDGAARMRTHTNSTADSGTSGTSLGAISTPFTTPDMNTGLGSPDTNGTPATPTTTSTPLTPVTAMPTSDAEAQIGLAKVAEPDVDAFMTYAAIVPEYCRLENMLVKSLV
jgi:xylulokinase